MGCCCSSSPPPKTLHMMFFITTTTIFFLLSLHITHILISDASLDAAGAGYFNAHGLQQKLQYMMESGKVEKVSGEDEIEEKENLFVQNFRALLGLKNFNIRSSSTEYVSPAPSPSAIYEAEGQPPTPAPTPAPAPAHRIHVHSHPPRHHSNHMPSLFKIPKEHKGKGRFKTILVVVIVTAAAAFLVCVIGLIWVVSGKFRKSSQSSARPVSMHRRKARTRGISKYRSSVKPASKVSLNPALDLLYLNSLEGDIEQQATYIKQTPETVNSLANHSTPEHRSHEREESKQEVTMKPESDNASSSSTREIMSVHEDVESERYASDGGNSSTGDKIIPIEWHSSDDESFHSFIDSHSSSVRLSNASAGTLTDVSEISPSNVTKTPPSPPSAPIDVDIQQTAPIQNILSPTPTEQSLTESSKSCNEETMAVSCPSYPDKNFTPPPPPPSPLPPRTLPFPRMRSITTNTSSCSAGIASKASISSTPPNLPTTTKPDSSPGSKQRPETTQSELPPTPQRFPKSSQATSSIPTPPCPPPFLKGNISPGKGPPPPPCPPPFLKGNSSSAKGPPLPPSQLPPYTPVGKDGVPLPKLKPLHWDKVRAAPDGNMVWDKIRSSSFELDEEMIESLFGYNLQCTTKTEEAKSKTPSPSKHVLEPKRLQNITILSKALNANAEKICDALIRGDGLCLQQLEALAKMVLTKEEEAKLFGYKGDINELGSAERFVRIVLTIPFSFLRIEAMLYRETFEDEVVHLRGSFSMLEEACKELRSSRLFLKLLEAVLKTGNRMNVGTIRGGARAFKLDTLLKLSDVKGTDGKTTLLHFVVQEIVRSEGIRVSDSIMGKINQKNKTKSIEEREEDYRRMGLDLVSGLSTELYNVKKTATIDLDVLANSVSNLSEGMSKLQHLVEKDLSMDEKSANFVHTMKAFLRYAARNIKELKEDEDRVLLHVRQITEYFHGHVSKDEANPLRIFVIVRDFLGMLDHVCKELRSLKVPNSPNPLAPFR